MALKDVKTSGSGGKSHRRYVTREEVKTSIRKVRRVEDAAEELPPITEPSTDFIIEDHNSVCLVRPMTAVAKDWLNENIQDPMYLGNAVSVEARYLESLVYGIQGDGLEIEFKS